MMALLLMTFLMDTPVTISPSPTGCSIGWFGPDCSYQCHCSAGTCDLNGQCIKCANGYFGPSCQYINLAETDYSLTNPSYLTDMDDLTCNPSKYAQVVRLTLTKRQRFTWLRLRVHNSTVLGEFELRLNDGLKKCENELRFPVDNSTLDVSCDSVDLVKIVAIYGQVAPHICSIAISGGRNVALRQNTKLSSTFTTINSKSDARNAVDGSSNFIYAAGFCFNSGKEPRGAQWSLKFNRSKSLYRIKVFSADINKEMLSEISITTHGSTGTVVHSIVGPEKIIPVYDFVLLHADEPVKSVTINADIGNEYLTICEVQVFGEDICQEGTYGLNCMSECKCKGYEVCNQVTGVCVSGCPAGTYGFQCKSPCDSACVNEKCLQRSGSCYMCPPGIGGDSCNTKCGPGTYGKSCEEECSKNCVGTCDPSNGTCLCQPGYMLPLCTECPKTTFGLNCSNTCSSLCLKGLCSHVTGACNKCTFPRFGEFCTECPNGTFGSDCSEICSDHCKGAVCGQLDGECFECEYNRLGKGCKECRGGYFGPKCNIMCPSKCDVTGCNSSNGLCFSCVTFYSGLDCSRSDIRKNMQWILCVPLGLTFLLVGFVRYRRTLVDDEETVAASTNI